jgi:hypothetical protein
MWKKPIIVRITLVSMYCLFYACNHPHGSLPEIYTEIIPDPDPLLFSVVQEILLLFTERLSRSTLHLVKGGAHGERVVCTPVLCSFATVLSCIDPSVRMVTKSPKAGRTLRDVAT